MSFGYLHNWYNVERAGCASTGIVRVAVLTHSLGSGMLTGDGQREGPNEIRVREKEGFFYGPVCGYRLSSSAVGMFAGTLSGFGEDDYGQDLPAWQHGLVFHVEHPLASQMISPSLPLQQTLRKPREKTIGERHDSRKITAR